MAKKKAEENPVEEVLEVSEELETEDNAILAEMESEMDEEMLIDEANAESADDLTDVDNQDDEEK